MMVDKEEEFRKIVEMVQMKPEIKKLMEGLVRQMKHNEKLVTEYKVWKDENERINASIVSEVREKSLKEGLQKGIKEGVEKRNIDFVLSMYNDNVSIELISKYANLSVLEVEEIIQKNNNVE